MYKMAKVYWLNHYLALMTVLLLLSGDEYSWQQSQDRHLYKLWIQSILYVCVLTLDGVECWSHRFITIFCSFPHSTVIVYTWLKTWTFTIFKMYIQLSVWCSRLTVCNAYFIFSLEVCILNVYAKYATEGVQSPSSHWQVAMRAILH